MSNWPLVMRAYAFGQDFLADIITLTVTLCAAIVLEALIKWSCDER